MFGSSIQCNIPPFALFDNIVLDVCSNHLNVINNKKLIQNEKQNWKSKKKHCVRELWGLVLQKHLLSWKVTLSQQRKRQKCVFLFM